MTNKTCYIIYYNGSPYVVFSGDLEKVKDHVENMVNSLIASAYWAKGLQKKIEDGTGDYVVSYVFDLYLFKWSLEFGRFCISKIYELVYC